MTTTQTPKTTFTEDEKQVLSALDGLHLGNLLPSNLLKATETLIVAGLVQAEVIYRLTPAGQDAFNRLCKVD